MNDQEVLALLRRIDGGYEPTKEEQLGLSCIEKIEWKKIEKLPESIVKLTSLLSLDLSFTQIRELPENIGSLTSLRSLDLRYTHISKLPESLGNLTSLQELYLTGIHITKLPESLGNLTSLQELFLNYVKIKELPESIGNLTSLRILYLRDTQINKLSESIGNLTSLRSLDLSGSKISELPESISDLRELKNLWLEGCFINELPERLLSLNLEYNDKKWGTGAGGGSGIHIYGLQLKNQPVEIFSQGREVIIEYYESTKKEAAIPINECKVVFLGDGGAGKSLIIDRLMNDGNISPDFDGESTPGICINSKKYPSGNDEIELHFWDFGGQAIMHSMHRLFLTNRTLYVVVANARDNKANEQALYWIRNIKSFASGAPILLLVNQKDQNPSANVNVNGLRKEYPNLGSITFLMG